MVLFDSVGRKRGCPTPAVQITTATYRIMDWPWRRPCSTDAIVSVVDSRIVAICTAIAIRQAHINLPETAVF